MDHFFTPPNVRKNKVTFLFIKAFSFLFLLFSQALTVSAHTVDYFSTCGYVCAGSTVNVNAHLSATATNTNYNWQFKDNSGVWKCFINGSNAINGAAFTVSGATAKGQLSAAPTLAIINASTQLNNVVVRIVMADGTNVSPCAPKPTYPVYGTDKMLTLHVLTGNDCSNIAAFCAGTSAKLKLGDLIWNDINGNGVKDANEPGVPNATVKLYADANNDNVADGVAIATTTTDAAGLYSFSNLASGNYIVGVIIPVGYTRGPASTIDPDNNVNNDNNGVYYNGPDQAGSEVRSKAITLTASAEPTTDGDDANSNLTLDIALCGNGIIGNFVWNDSNANGIQDANEPGIPGVMVKLTFPDGVTTSTETTDQNGNYLFTSLAPGNYKVTFTTPTGLVPSPSNQGSDDNKDSDPVNGVVSVTLAAGVVDNSIDAGFYKKPVTNLSLGNQVWNDFDGDGKRDPDEPGIPGATISLYTDNDGDNRPDGPAIRTTVTDASGHYQFTNLAEGRYIASMPILPGYQKSPNSTTQDTSPNPDNNVDNDNNLVRLDGPNGPGGIMYTNAITLNEGQEPDVADDGDDTNGNNTFDLAECGNSFIGDFVWNDLNGNGIQDAGEPGINGVNVTITFSDGRTATTTTHNYNAPNNPNDPIFDGYYNFPNLGPGTYKISFSTPVGLHETRPNAGDDSKDSDPVNGAPVTVTLAPNQSDFTIDAGFTAFIPPPPPPTCPNLSVGNMVFNDANGNGVRDASEQGIGGLTVKLYADNNGDNLPDGAAISTVITADDGTYYFGNLAEGKYIVGVTTGLTYSQDKFADATPDDNKDNDNNGIRTVSGEVLSNSITLTPGLEPINDGSDNNSNLTLDFGLTSTCGTHCDCHNDCNHVGCGHPNCGHNNCKNDCNHTTCTHPNCGHNSCHNDCNHVGCGHANCGKKTDAKEDETITSTVVSVFPNPATDYCQVKVVAVKEGKGVIRITDSEGHILLTKEVTLSLGSNTITFNDLSSLKGGKYDIQLLFNYHVYNLQVLLLK